jgi:hypothetical protein
VDRVYKSREEVVLFLEEENQVQAEYFPNEHSVSKLAYLNHIFDFNTREFNAREEY